MEPSVLSDEDVFDKLEELVGEASLFLELPLREIPHGAVLVDVQSLSAQRKDYYVLIKHSSPWAVRLRARANLCCPGDMRIGAWLARPADNLLREASTKATDPHLGRAPYGMYVLAIPKEVADALAVPAEGPSS